MYAKQIKLIEKHIRKQNNSDAIASLLDILVKLKMSNVEKGADYNKVGRLLASVLPAKKNRATILSLIKGVPQESMIFLCMTAAEFGQLSGAVKLIEDAYPIEQMSVALFNFYLDLLDSLMYRAKALEMAYRFLEQHQHLSLGALSTSHVLQAWSTEQSTKVMGQCNKTDEELELLNLFYKIIKLCYTEGKLASASAIANTLIDTVNTAKDLHLTKIRNGNSYYQYLIKLLPLKKSVESNGVTKLYMVGDSHCLSPGWEQITLANMDYQIQPLLVTGCKIWHLRDRSDFHAKVNFYQALEQIPQNASAIFVFGEIDCREGVLLAVEKGKYKSIPEAMKVLLDIYMNRLQEAIRLRHLKKIYVHLVPPVLNETRKVVMLFNEMLKARLEANRQRNPNTKISWLPLKNNLLDEQGKLDADYGLDGTHLHPKYIHEVM